MQQALIISVLAIAVVFLAMTVLIVGGKAWRQLAARYRERRRKVLEPQVLRFVHTNDKSVLAALGGELRTRDRRVMEEILLDHAQRVRGIERERLCQAIDELGYVDRYLDRLHGRRWWKRADAAEKLGLAGASRAVGRLVQSLEDESSEVRMRAAKALGVLGGESSIRPLIRALDEPNRWSTIRIADILTSMGRDVLDELIEQFDAMTLPGKLAALDIVGRIRPLRLLPWLEERLTDEEPDVRARTCHALGAIGDPNTGSWLARALGDPEWPVRAMAAKALGKVRHREAIPVLCTVLRDREWWPRANAAEALRLLGDPGIEALKRMLRDEDNYARHQAVLKLEECGVLDQTAALLDAADERDREAARQMLARVIDAGQTGRLRELAERHDNAKVRDALAGLLAAAPKDAPEAEASP